MHYAADQVFFCEFNSEKSARGKAFTFKKSRGPQKWIFFWKFANSFLLLQQTFDKKKMGKFVFDLVQEKTI